MRVLTFGELMMRLMTPNHEKIKQAKSFNLSYAGSEANVAVSLAYFNLNSSYITAVPNNDLGKSAINVLRYHNVNVSNVLLKEGRLGIYFVENGFSKRPSRVIYDRRNSAFSVLIRSEIDWKSILASYDWFHFSGITPALSSESALIIEDALIEAKKQGIKISCDLNYRSKLWTKEEASETMLKYMQYVDVLIGNEEDAKVIFGFKYEKSDVQSLNVNEYNQILNYIDKSYGLKKIYFTLRESISASKNKWSSIGFDGINVYNSTKYEIDILDRLGAGDSFSAGVIYGEINNFNIEKTIEFATAASCLKHTIHEDFNIVSLEEVYELMYQKNIGRIVR